MAILLAFFTVLIEHMFLLAWVPIYFRTGIPVFSKTFPSSRSLNLSRHIPAIEQNMKDQLWHLRIEFRAITPLEYAFRENFLEFRFPLVRGILVMHSLIRIHPNTKSFSITGYLNWYILLLAMAIIADAIIHGPFAIVALVFFLMLVLISYMVEAQINSRIGKMASEYLSGNNISTTC